MYRFVSDIHVERLDAKQLINVLKKFESDTYNRLVIAGDLGNQTHTNYKEVLKFFNQKYQKTLLVPGNHDLMQSAECSPSVLYYQNKLNEVVNQYPNIQQLQCESFDNIYGCTLFSYLGDKKNIHNVLHTNHVDYLKQIINKNKNNNITIVTHYVPTMKVADPRYKNPTKFCSDLEYLFQKNITWYCGHIHQKHTIKVKDMKLIIDPFVIT
jgi:Icc-related predicted phosphoesterase